MKPNFKLLADNQDITDAIRSRFVSLTLSNDGIKNDTLSIVIDDRGNEVVLPRTDVEIECWLGYGDDLYNKGSFEVDEVITSGISVLLQKALGLTSHSNQSRTHANIQ